MHVTQARYARDHGANETPPYNSTKSREGVEVERKTPGSAMDERQFVSWVDLDLYPTAPIHHKQETGVKRFDELCAGNSVMGVGSMCDVMS